jgi:hypothetical protein
MKTRCSGPGNLANQLNIFDGILAFINLKRFGGCAPSKFAVEQETFGMARQ